MEYAINLTLLYLFLIFSIDSTEVQNVASNRVSKLSPYLNVDKITSIEVYDIFTKKKWTLNNVNLLKVKAILKKSTLIPSVVVKPSHLYIKIKGAEDFSNYDTYMYDTIICFDPFLDKTTLEPIKNTHGFSIELVKKIDWEKLE